MGLLTVNMDGTMDIPMRPGMAAPASSSKYSTMMDWSPLPDLNCSPADTLSNLRSLLAELSGEALASLSSGDASAARLLLSVLAEVDG